jgi:DNA polymerase III epsilon subunit-like protein
LGPIEEGALKVTGKTREQISKAPKLKPVWKKFVNFVNKYNWKKTPFFAPVPAGFNILGYDMHIIRRICKELGPWDEKRQDQQLFSQIYKVDMMDNYYMWTEGDPTVKSRSMDAIRKRLGMSEENAHDALQDVKDTANIMIKFMKTHRAVYKNLKLDKAFADGELYV